MSTKPACCHSGLVKAGQENFPFHERRVLCVSWNRPLCMYGWSVRIRDGRETNKKCRRWWGLVCSVCHCMLQREMEFHTFNCDTSHYKTVDGYRVQTDFGLRNVCTSALTCNT